MIRQPDAPASIEFDHFSIFPHRRQLFADSRPITLGGRAFDVLLALIEAPGRLSAREAAKLSMAGQDRRREGLADEISVLGLALRGKSSGYERGADDQWVLDDATTVT